MLSGDHDLGRAPARARAAPVACSGAPATPTGGEDSPGTAAMPPLRAKLTGLFRFVSDLLRCSFSRFFIASKIPCKEFYVLVRGIRDKRGLHKNIKERNFYSSYNEKRNFADLTVL